MSGTNLNLEIFRTEDGAYVSMVTIETLESNCGPRCNPYAHIIFRSDAHSCEVKAKECALDFLERIQEETRRLTE
jgi:hypothetical protein